MAVFDGRRRIVVNMTGPDNAKRRKAKDELVRKLATAALFILKESRIESMSISKGADFELVYYVHNVDMFERQAVNAIANNVKFECKADLDNAAQERDFSKVWTKFCKKFRCDVEIEQSYDEDEEDYYFCFTPKGFKCGKEIREEWFYELEEKDE